ncbi:MAG: hypothetical protein ABH869_06910 [Candidatus Omnitrophota bacterium]
MEEKEKNFDANSTLYTTLSYLWVLCLIPVLGAKKKDPFVMFHARQGLMLLIIEIAFVIIRIVPLFGWIVYKLGILICAILSLVGIINVLMGKKWAIPVIDDWAKKLKI